MSIFLSWTTLWRGLRRLPVDAAFWKHKLERVAAVKDYACLRFDWTYTVASRRSPPCAPSPPSIMRKLYGHTAKEFKEMSASVN